MDRGPAVIDGAAPRTSGSRGPRRLLAAGLAALVVLLGAVAVLATRLASTPPAATPAAPPSPSPAAPPVGRHAPGAPPGRRPEPEPGRQPDRAGHLPARRAVRRHRTHPARPGH